MVWFGLLWCLYLVLVLRVIWLVFASGLLLLFLLWLVFGLCVVTLWCGVWLAWVGWWFDSLIYFECLDCFCW